MRESGTKQWGCLNPLGHWTQGSKVRPTWVNWDVSSPYAKVNVEMWNLKVFVRLDRFLLLLLLNTHGSGVHHSKSQYGTAQRPEITGFNCH